MLLAVARALQSEGSADLVLAMRARTGAVPHVNVEYLDPAMLGERFFFRGGQIPYRGASRGPPAVAVEPPGNASMLVASLEWLRADVVGDFGVHRSMVHPDAEMFGAKGADEVLAFKQAFLKAFPAYEVPAVFVDHTSRVVVAEFVCLVPGKEGRGTDFMAFDDEMRVTRVSAVRHAAAAAPL